MALGFHLNGRPHRVEGVAPSTTVLDYLREHLGLTGTKEGCAEGDCGACTIALQERGAPWRPANSCLMLLPQLDGLAVLTVEGIAGAEGGLHPVQSALVESDGTQCGFCTPGFVVAMFALAAGDPAPADTDIHEALAGNLCRCTGYRPIVEACRRVGGAPALPVDEDLPPIGEPPSRDYVAPGGYHRLPRSLDELLQDRAAHPEARLLAGGTDLGLLPSRHREPLPALISTSRVPELRRIEESDDAVLIGAAVPYAEALPALENAFPSFAALLKRLGSRQIRSLGTLGGNLATASPIGDTLPVLIALEAEVCLRSLRGARNLPVEAFITGYRSTALEPDEVIEAVRLPKLRDGQRLVAYKLSKRYDQDISSVVAAFRLEVRDGVLADLRAVYGGMGPVTARALAVEAHLVGRPWVPENLTGLGEAMARDFTPMSDHRAGAAYRLTTAVNLVHRLQIETTTDDVPVHLEAL